jgi:hypothetical protein
VPVAAWPGRTAALPKALHLALVNHHADPNDCRQTSDHPPSNAPAIRLLLPAHGTMAALLNS